MKLNYYGPIARETGYSRAAHDYLECLLTTDIDLNILPIMDGKETLLEERYHNLLSYVNREDAKDPSWPDVIICHAIPYGCSLFLNDTQAPPPEVKRIALTTWETSKLPEESDKELVAMFDQIWVPSQFCRDAFSHSYEKTRVVPHSIDGRFWKPKSTERNWAVFGSSPPYDPYIFYTILTWCELKNPMGLLKAYLTEFTEEDNVLLRIRTPGYNNKDIEELVRSLRLDYLPPVEIVEEYLTERQLRDLHYKSDCYVTCARAEGWGLGAFEAAALGKPVVATAFSGLTDFLDDYANNRKIPWFWTPAYTPESISNNSLEIAGLSITPTLRNDHIGIQGNQSWAEPDLGTLKGEMRDVYSEQASERLEEGFRILDKYSYKKIGALMKQNLEALFK